MYQAESIYNLLPSQKIGIEKDKMYHSKYPHWIAPTASTFILGNTSYPGVASTGGGLQFPRGAHPITGGWRSMGLPKGGYKINPEKFIRKNHQYKIIPEPERIKSNNEIRKPPVVTIYDKPIMGLKSQKNYVKSNAVDAILMQPRKRKIKGDNDLDYYLNKKEYGKVPNYLERAKTATQRRIYENFEIQRENERYEQSKKKVIDDNELSLLKEGLQKRLNNLRQQYGKITHRRRFDTLTTKNYKENLEKEIEIVEKDLEKLNKDKVIVDLMN
jgi:hypothetical protein